MDHLKRFVARLDLRIEALERVSQLYSWIRLGVFLAGLAAVLVWWDSDGRWGSVVAAAAAFLMVVRLHDRVLSGLTRLRTYRRIKELRIARIRRDWDGLPPASDAPVPSDHPFAWDLDLVGPRSVHRLMDTAFSTGGSHLLAEWLTSAPPGARERQRLVRSLVRLTAFCDRIALLSTVFGKRGDRFDSSVLSVWLERPVEERRIRGVLLILSGLAAVTAVLAVLHLLGVAGPQWAFSLTAYAAVYLMNGRLYGHLFDEAETLHSELEKLRPVVRYLERYRGPRPLEEHLAPFRGERPPSRVLRRVMWLAVAASAQKSEVLRLVLNAIAPWDLYFTWRLNRVRLQLRDDLPRWLDCVFKLEAAASLATFAALNPEATFPGLEGAGFEAEGLGHPLIPRDALVRNDLRSEAGGKVVLVTGSNMSGKSTFLRAVGIAQAMAAAGGPVDAASLRSAPLTWLSSMDIRDSVTDGISYFYAEVRRLGAMMRTARSAEGACLVLIDEIFRGTNNRERLEGSRAILRELAGLNCLALVATHDLDLVRLEESLPGVRNVHFREEVSGGRMTFDYLLHDGPCPTTNALKIMALEGLPVPD